MERPAADADDGLTDDELTGDDLTHDAPASGRGGAADPVEEAEAAVHGDVAAAEKRAFARDILRSLAEGRFRLCASEAELPDRLPEVSEPLPLTFPSLRVLRRAVEAACRAQGLSEERWRDLIGGVGEAGLNAVIHAKGGTATVCAAGGKVQVWLRDRGHGIETRCLQHPILDGGMVAPGAMGHGFWLMLKTCDAVYLLTGPAGTTIVLEQQEREPATIWRAGRAK